MKFDRDTRDVFLFVLGITGLLGEFLLNDLTTRTPNLLDYAFMLLFASFAIGGGAPEDFLDRIAGRLGFERKRPEEAEDDK